jgi:hypothetical protein
LGVLRREIGGAGKKIFGSRGVADGRRQGPSREAARNAGREAIASRGTKKHLEKSAFEKTAEASGPESALRVSGSMVPAMTVARLRGGVGPENFFAQVVDTMKKRD